MEKLYYSIPYVREFEAEVVSCTREQDGFEVILNRTGFYPEGGGQPSDTGTLGEANVFDVHEKNGTVVHYTDRMLEKGSIVKGTIKWAARYMNMQQHSGEHIVSGLIHAQYGYDNVGFHMGKEEMTIDLNGALTWEQLMEIERKANRIIYENLFIHAYYPSEEERNEIDYRSKKELTGEVRIVEIPDADVCACCGTHVQRTGEIGLIKFLTMINYKGGVRISMLCGEKALQDYEKKTEQTLRLSSLLSAKPEKIEEAVTRLKQENGDKDVKIGRLIRQLMEMKAERYEKGKKMLLVFEEDFQPVQVRQFCDLLIKEEKAQIVAVCSGTEDAGYSYCIGSRTFDARNLGKNMNEVLNGRGGGKKQMVQGTFRAGRCQIEEAFYKNSEACFL